MDTEFLENIAGSPYVEEGVFDRAVARGMSGAQRVSAMTGGPMTDPNYSKVESLLITLQKRVLTVLKDFAGGTSSIANRLRQLRGDETSKPNAQQLQVIQQLEDLYTEITKTLAQRHQLGNLTPPNASRSQSSLSEMVEGFFNREIPLNKALQTNNATTIVNAYVNELKKIYDSFVADATKVTGFPKDYVAKAVGNLNPKWASVLTKISAIAKMPLQALPPVLPTTEPSATTGEPKPAQAAPENPQADSGAVPPVLPKAQQPEQPTQASDGKISQVEKSDFVGIIARVAEIVIQTVSSDKERSAKFMAQGSHYPKGPGDWETPAVTKEADEPQATDEEPPTDKEKELGDEADEEATGEFIYDFHSLYRKQRHFTIDVTPTDGNLELFELSSKKTKRLKVVWNNNQHENNIYVKHTDVDVKDKKDDNGTTVKDIVPTGKTGQVLLFRFTDDQVDPRSPSSLAGNKFITTIMERANPQLINIMSKADPKVVAKLASFNDALFRAFYATTTRKAMEFKRKEIPFEMDAEGNLFKKTKKGKEPIPQSVVMAKIHSSDKAERERWINSLTKAGYFDKHPDVMQGKTSEPNDIADIPAAMDGVKALETMKIGKMEALKAIKQAVQILGPKASSEDYTKQALKIVKGVTPTTPPVSAPVSSPVSAPVSAPASSGKSPEPEKTAPTSPVEIKDDGTINFVDPTTKKAVSRKYGTGLPSAIIHQINADPELKKKFDALKDKSNKKKHPGTVSEFINPFRKENFL